ncbi:hypothetical protein SAMN05444671_3323 [Flavobacterium sp. CF108]|uniref:hypothetical protein n=1 Tax=unclassified Flavobacterium TaxID=196869 RepID=UPI0008AFC07B|nr:MULTISPECIES: hypothetical protein [unclassified Flavobacterium]SEO39197.1 hypothetical protein SAMN04487978_2758 [Flavobacterium sp. fv08]SHH65990.1 hypothetical protein SAMN05444671_3323 [Flavobacterium sp. CF108]
MKKIYLLLLITSIVFISCSKDDSSSETASLTQEKIETFNFSSYSKMDEKIDEISLIKEQMETATVDKYTQISDKNTSRNTISEGLKVYHTDRINNIYSLRKKLNFTSIQSIADEINSLVIINPIKSNELFETYKNLLTKNELQVKTIFENRTANVINTKGEVLINGKIEDFKINISKNGKYIGDESVKTGVAAYSTNMGLRVDYSTGREKHKDDFGKTFFRYFTEFNAYLLDTKTGQYIPYPVDFIIISNSYAGFSQTGSNPLSDFAFTMEYPSGKGTTVRNTGGQKWTAYQTEGGYINALFRTKIAPFLTASCDFKYTR